MTPDVMVAVEEIRQAFPDHKVDAEEEPQGGAYVVVHELSIGDAYVPPSSWVGFLIPFQYPRAEVYPHFIDGAVKRADGGPHGGGFSGPTSWRDLSVIQVSRKSNRWDSLSDTAATKLAKVLDWMRSE